MAAKNSQFIILSCGDLKLLMSTSCLIRESGYFRTLLLGSFSDSGLLDHTLGTEMVEPESLLLIVLCLKYGVQWEPPRLIEENRLFRTALACEALQFFDHCWPTEVMSSLTEAELFWILRNPNIVDPTGGVLALTLIDVFVRHHFLHSIMSNKNFDAKDRQKFLDRGLSCDIAPMGNDFSSSELLFQKFIKAARAMTSRLVFALLESIEAREIQNFPIGFVRRAVLPTISDESCNACSKREMATSKGERGLPVFDPSNSKNVKMEEKGFRSRSKFELPLSHKDVHIIEKHLKDKNVFALMYNTQKKTVWKACFKANEGCTSPRNCMCHKPSIISYNEETRAFELQLRNIDLPSSSNVCVYGEDMLVMEGHRQEGYRMEAAPVVRNFNWRSRKWRNIPLSQPIPYVSFQTCWLASRGALIYECHNSVFHQISNLMLLTTYDDDAQKTASGAGDRGSPSNLVIQSDKKEESLNASRIRSMDDNFTPQRDELDFSEMFRWNLHISRTVDQYSDSAYDAETLSLSTCEAPYLRIEKPYNYQANEIYHNTELQYPMVKKFRAIPSYTSEDKTKYRHTFELSEESRLALNDLHDGPHHVSLQEKISIFTIGEHCLAFIDDALYIKCPGKQRWRTMKYHIHGGQACLPLFIAVIPYGVGLYLVSNAGQVYFMPLRTYKYQDYKSYFFYGREKYYCLTFMLFPYATLQSNANQVCRVEDKLYACGRRNNYNFVEMLPLLYNPLNPGGDVEVTLDPASVPSVYNLFYDGLLSRDQINSADPYTMDFNQRASSCSDVHTRNNPLSSPAIPSTPADSSVIHKSSPEGETIFPDVMPSASSIRRTASKQHRLLDQGVLRPLLNFYDSVALISTKLTPAGLFAVSLIEEMKSNLYPNWTIEETDHYQLSEDLRFLEHDECRWCRNVCKIWPHANQSCSVRKSTIIEVSNSQWNFSCSRDFKSFEDGWDCFSILTS
ncbi:hypothetical protein FHG87_003957 [Trinorchestia longiramus]|nr:hypothetical protein FHG87_003957 [Trinorchestia longiramus]